MVVLEDLPLVITADSVTTEQKQEANKYYERSCICKSIYEKAELAYHQGHYDSAFVYAEQVAKIKS